MSVSETIRKLEEQRNFGMSHILKRICAEPKLIPDLPFDLASIMAESEEQERAFRKRKRLNKNAKLRYSTACMEDIDYLGDRKLDRNLMSWFAQCLWVERKENMIITGSTGVGKSFIACAMANQAIRCGYSVLYKRVPRLMEELELAHAEGVLAKTRIHIKNFDILLLDEWAVFQLTPRAKLDLLEIIEDRTKTGSIIVTSQLPVEQWHAYIDEPTLADAILDRIVHNSHKINLSGESMRKTKDSVQEITHAN